MVQSDFIPVTVLTGFLGSGKTTVLNHLLRQPNMEGVAVIINEFGEVGIDHLLTETSQERFALLENGCVCCSVRDDLVQILIELKHQVQTAQIPPIGRILIETTGLADPIPILHTLMVAPDLAGTFSIDGVVTTVDAVNIASSLDRFPEAARQIAVADRILITKSDLIDQATYDVMKRRVAQINPTVSIVKVLEGHIEPELVFQAGMFEPDHRSEDVAAWFIAAAQPSYHRHGSISRHKHDAGFSSFSLIVREPIRWEAFLRWYNYVVALKGEELLRFKAFLNIADRPEGPVIIHAVQHVLHPPVKMASWPSEDKSSRLVFIVRDISSEAVKTTLMKFGEVSPESLIA